VIQVQNPDGLTEGINHVVIAIGVERIAAVVASNRDRYTAAAHFVDRRNAAPAWCSSTVPVLKIKIYGRQRNDRYSGFGAEVECSAHLLFGLDRKAATMAANYATPEAVAQNCCRDTGKRGRRRISALVYVQIDIETAL